VLTRPARPDSALHRALTATKRAAGELVLRGWDAAVELGAIGPDTRRGKRFGSLGAGSVICFPATAIFNERYIHIGTGTMIGPQATLSAGMVPGQQCLSDDVVRIGDRCLLGKGSAIVGHLGIVIGDDVWTGHNVYITDQNHGYEDITVPISRQSMPERRVRIGDGSWLGYGTVVLPGADIGRHVVVGANSVVTGEIPDFSVAVGAPARVVRRYDPVSGSWLGASVN
jgi:acetyltransferase-like isoleucine patch superfamily enzyme